MVADFLMLYNLHSYFAFKIVAFVSAVHLAGTLFAAILMAVRNVSQHYHLILSSYSNEYDIMGLQAS